MKSIILFAALFALLSGVVLAQDAPPPPVQERGGQDGQGQRGGGPGQGRGQNRGPQFDFDTIDKNKDGKISKEELTAQFAQLAGGQQGGQPGRGVQPGGGGQPGQPGRPGQGPQGPGGFQAQILQGFDAADANHDGFLSREEFTAMMAGFRARGGGQFGAFRFIGMQLITVLDTNKDGKLSKEEFVGVKTELFDKLDKDKDGFLSVEEAQAIITIGGGPRGFGGPGGGQRPDGQGGQGGQGRQGRQNGQGGQGGQARADGPGGQPGQPGQPGRARINYNLDELDKNKDGKVAPDEWIGSPDVFRSFDTNKDGFLTKDELDAASKRAAQNARRVGEQMVQVLDTNNDNKISRDEFGKFIDLFDKMDKNADGFLAADELSPLMTLANEARIQATAGIDIDQLIKKYDKNGDSKLSAEEMADGANGPKLFKAIDANKDGFVTREEIVTWVQAVAAKKDKAKAAGSGATAPAQSPKP